MDKLIPFLLQWICTTFKVSLALKKLGVFSHSIFCLFLFPIFGWIFEGIPPKSYHRGCYCVFIFGNNVFSRIIFNRLHQFKSTSILVSSIITEGGRKKCRSVFFLEALQQQQQSVFRFEFSTDHPFPEKRMCVRWRISSRFSNWMDLNLWREIPFSLLFSNGKIECTYLELAQHDCFPFFQLRSIPMDSIIIIMWCRSLSSIQYRGATAEACN